MVKAISATGMVNSFADTMDEKPSPDWLRNLPTRSEDVGYSPDELRTCDSCGKPNAPNRAACLYCGAAFAGVAPRLEIREVEDWENGFNVILTGFNGGDIAKVVDELGTTFGEQGVLRSALESGKSLPIARLESDDVAAAVARSLGAHGISTRVVPDETLALSTPQIRLRSIKFRDDALALTLFNGDEITLLDRVDLALVFTGVLHELRTEAMEKRKRRETKTLSESQTSHDEAFVDIYSRHNGVGWRIPSSGFDFSCLGDEKSLLAGENLERLVSKMVEFAPDARFVNDYPVVRPLLETVWPGDHRREVFGFQRSGFARKDLSSMKTSSNLTQVSKYSRLQWHLL